MAEEKESTSIPLSQAVDPGDPAKAPPISPSSSTRKVHACLPDLIVSRVMTSLLALMRSVKACGAVLQSWVSKKFITGWKDVCRLPTSSLDSCKFVARTTHWAS
ncbi:hypothetical protein ZIOFF_062732 [Zingiber officinale]|uniref:Uncharacterized protein n=1 Tax=Zingiber officinale TaxID=94328 RepID=A0A8J5F0T2_ZINOF|nr:hypothetical protein ZIOFF_062732 [Zingiber officinale]